MVKHMLLECSDKIIHRICQRFYISICLDSQIVRICFSDSITRLVFSLKRCISVSKVDKSGISNLPESLWLVRSKGSPDDDWLLAFFFY